MNEKLIIKQRYEELFKMDSKMRHDALKEVSKKTNTLFKNLQEECELTGHSWVFSNYNFDGTARWNVCEFCRKKEVDENCG